jgi:myo-inositol 2-dehydrogenase/D-chiro-inositol 1-dehydrogenase
MDPVRIAVIGSGKMASVHAANIVVTPGARLVAVAGGSRAAALAARHGAEALSVETALADPAIDAVVVASPNSHHAEHLREAATRGKAVLVEKPVDLDLGRVDDCIRAVGAAADRVVVAFNRRFDPSFAGLRARVVAGEIGGVGQLLIVSRDPAAPPLDYLPGSGGLFLDMARFVVGDIAAVRATGQAGDPEVAALGDFTGASITLTAASGALVTIVNARSNASGYDQRLEAFGPAGTLSVGNPSEDLVSRSGAGVVGARGALISHYGDRYREAYRAEIAHLVAVTRGEAAPVATLRDGREALVIADAATRSARTGGREEMVALS